MGAPYRHALFPGDVCVPEVAAARAKESHRVCELVGRVGYALAGLPAARLSGHLGIAGSADTVLRRVKARGPGHARGRGSGCLGLMLGRGASDSATARY